jgi:hypothetical protein
MGDFIPYPVILSLSQRGTSLTLWITVRVEPHASIFAFNFLVHFRESVLKIRQESFLLILHCLT